MASIRTVEDLIKAIQNSEVLFVVIDTAVSFKDEYTKLNLEQLSHGYDSNLQLFDQYKSEPYANFKNLMNPAPGFGNPDLHLHGGFYAGTYTEVEQTTGDIYTTSDDEKTAMIEKKYKKNDIFGLGGQYAKSWIEMQEESFLNNYRKKIGL
jgi:hypothetical protein